MTARLPHASVCNGGYRQTRAASDNQTPAHSCRPVHTGAISKRLASVTRQGSLLERSYRLTLGKRGRHLYAWHGVPRYLCLRNTLIYAHVSLQCVHNLTRRKRLVNACRLPPASVCNRHHRHKGATISLSGGGELEDFFSVEVKADFLFTHHSKPDFFFTKNGSKVRFLKKIVMLGGQLFLPLC